MNQSLKSSTGRPQKQSEGYNPAATNKSLLEQPGTVKEKFHYLLGLAEDLCKNVEDEINHLNDFSVSLMKKIEEEREKPKIYVREATAKLRKFEEQINKHFEHQKNENQKMENDIKELKGDKTSIEQGLLESSDWLNTLEHRIGILEPLGLASQGPNN